MKNDNACDGRLFAAGLGLLGVLAAAAPAALFAQYGVAAVAAPVEAGAADPDSLQTPEATVRDWPHAPRSLALFLIEKYGEPARFSDDVLSWDDNGTWRKTVVYRGIWPRVAGKRDKDYIKQTIPYRVPEDRVDDLRRFDPRITFDKAAEELSARTGSERMNFLALNLANEIVVGDRTVEDARRFQRRVEETAKAGKTSPYLDGFLFEVVKPSARPREP